VSFLGLLYWLFFLLVWFTFSFLFTCQIMFIVGHWKCCSVETRFWFSLSLSLSLSLCLSLCLSLYWDFNSRPYACWAGTLSLEPHPYPFLLFIILGIKSHIYVLASLDHDSPIRFPGMTGECQHSQQAFWLRWGPHALFSWEGLSSRNC
jgi:hypothetical protein